MKDEMDEDREVFGNPLYTINAKQAIEMNCVTDYTIIGCIYQNRMIETIAMSIKKYNCKRVLLYHSYFEA